MKKLMLLISIFSFYAIAFSQNVVVTCDKNNVLYIGVDNPISVAAANYLSDQIIVKADPGSIEVFNGRYSYRGTEPGSVRITVYKKSNLKEIGSWSFRLRYIPDPVAKVSAWSNGNNNARAIILKSQNWIRADLEDFDYDAMFRVDSFTLNVFYRDSCVIKEVFNFGNKFNNEVSETLKTIKNGDIVMFKHIYVIGPDGRRRLISPLVLTITD
jgi:hypothetical protein